MWVSALDDGVAGAGGDAALVVLVPGHHDVAILAPRGAPAARKMYQINTFLPNVRPVQPTLSLIHI